MLGRIIHHQARRRRVHPPQKLKQLQLDILSEEIKLKQNMTASDSGPETFRYRSEHKHTICMYVHTVNKDRSAYKHALFMYGHHRNKPNTKKVFVEMNSGRSEALQ